MIAKTLYEDDGNDISPTKIPLVDPLSPVHIPSGNLVKSVSAINLDPSINIKKKEEAKAKDKAKKRRFKQYPPVVALNSKYLSSRFK